MSQERRPGQGRATKTWRSEEEHLGLQEGGAWLWGLYRSPLLSLWEAGATGRELTMSTGMGLGLQWACLGLRQRQKHASPAGIDADPLTGTQRPAATALWRASTNCPTQEPVWLELPAFQEMKETKRFLGNILVEISNYFRI